MGSVNRSAPKLSRKGKHGPSRQAVGPAFQTQEGHLWSRVTTWLLSCCKLGVILGKDNS